MTKPHVLYLIGQLVRGGAEQQLYNLLAHVEPGATVVSFSPDGYWADPIRALGHTVIELERQGRVEVRRLREVRHIIRQERPDLVYVFIDGISGMYGRLGALLAGHRHVIVGQRSHPTYFPRWYLRLMPWLNRAITAVICNSYAARDYLIENGLAPARKLHVIHNGIDVAHIQATNATWPWPEDWRGKTVVGMVSHLTVPKSPETFIQLAAHIRQHHPEQAPDLRFALIGDGARRDEMAALVDELGVKHVLWLAGEQTDIPALLAHMDIFALTSRNEGTPNAVMEAMCAGLPCVVTAAGDCPHIVVEGETGYIVPVGNVAQLAERVLHLAHDATLRQRLGERGAARMQQEFALGVMARHYEDLFAQLFYT
ncbi:MAG: glycosyltransferase [Chloroflexi bacterium]|nr:glycosyltransferase [Chloroflexota bacterium]